MLITAAQDQALRANWINAKIDKPGCTPKSEICHVKLRHDMVGRELQAGRQVHRELCKNKHGISCSEKWYQHVPEMTTTTRAWTDRTQVLKSSGGGVGCHLKNQ